MIIDGKVDLVINTTEGEKSIKDSFSIRRNTYINKIIYATTVTAAKELVQAIKVYKENLAEVGSL